MTKPNEKLQARGGDMGVFQPPADAKPSHDHIAVIRYVFPRLDNFLQAFVQMHDDFLASDEGKALHALGDVRLAWVHEGDLYNPCVYPIRADLAAPDMAELVEALGLLVEACNGEVEEVFGWEIGPSLHNARAALAKIKEPQT